MTCSVLFQLKTLAIQTYIDGTVYFNNKQYTVRAYDRNDEHERILVAENDDDKIPFWLYIGDSNVTVKNPNGQDDALDGVASALKLNKTHQKSAPKVK